MEKRFALMFYNFCKGSEGLFESLVRLFLVESEIPLHFRTRSSSSPKVQSANPKVRFLKFFRLVDQEFKMLFGSL